MGKEVLSHSFPAVVSNGEISSVSSPWRIHYICLDCSNVIEREIVSLEKGTPLWRSCPCNSYRSLCARSAKLGTKPGVPWGHALPSLDQKHPNQQGATWAVGKSYAFLLSCLKTTPASSPDTRAHLREPNFQYWDFKRFSHTSLNLRVCKVNMSLLHGRWWTQMNA